MHDHLTHGLRTLDEEIPFTAQQGQKSTPIPKFLGLHWVFVIRDLTTWHGQKNCPSVELSKALTAKK